MMTFESGGVTTLLPNPQFSDSEGLTAEVKIVRAIDGTSRSYIKTKLGRRKLQWTFRLTRPKAIELREFYRVHFAQTIKVTDHNDRVWLGHFTSNPFEIEMSSRARPDLQGLRGETAIISIEFEGIEQ